MTQDQLTLFAGASPVRTYPLRGRAQGWPANDPDYGQKSAALLTTLDRNTLLWKTSQHCLVEGLETFSQTWPRSGMTRNGTAYQLPPLVPLTGAIACGLLPTPRKNDAQKRGNFDANNLRNGFPAAVKRLFLPTISKNEPKGAGRDRFRGSPHFRGAKMSEGLRTCEDDPIYLNPCFAELVMGFPIGWTELAPLETPSSRKSPKSSAKPSCKRKG